MAMLVLTGLLMPALSSGQTDYQKFLSGYAAPYQHYVGGGGGKGSSYPAYLQDSMANMDQHGTGARSGGGYENLISRYAGNLPSAGAKSEKPSGAEHQPVSFVGKETSASDSDKAKAGFLGYLDFATYAQGFGAAEAGDYEKYLRPYRPYTDSLARHEDQPGGRGHEQFANFPIYMRNHGSEISGLNLRRAAGGYTKHFKQASADTGMFSKNAQSRSGEDDRRSGDLVAGKTTEPANSEHQGEYRKHQQEKHRLKEELRSERVALHAELTAEKSELKEALATEAEARTKKAEATVSLGLAARPPHSPHSGLAELTAEDQEQQIQRLNSELASERAHLKKELQTEKQRLRQELADESEEQSSARAHAGGPTMLATIPDKKLLLVGAGTLAAGMLVTTFAARTWWLQHHLLVTDSEEHLLYVEAPLDAA